MKWELALIMLIAVFFLYERSRYMNRVCKIDKKLSLTIDVMEDMAKAMSELHSRIGELEERNKK